MTPNLNNNKSKVINKLNAAAYGQGIKNNSNAPYFHERNAQKSSNGKKNML